MTTAARPVGMIRKHIGHAAFAAVAVTMGLGAASQALFGLAVARWSTPATAGSFFVGLSLLTLLGYAGRFGSEQLTLRFGSPLWAAGDEESFSTLVRSIVARVMRSTTIVAAGAATVMGVVAVAFEPEVLVDSAEAWLALLTLFPLNLLVTCCAALRASDSLAASVFLRYLGMYVPALALLALGRTDAFPHSPMGALLATTAVAASALWLRMRRTTCAVDTGTAPELGSAPAQLTTSSVLDAALSWFDTIIVGVIVGAAAAGLYGTAWQLVMPFGLILLLGGTVGTPMFSRLHASGELYELESFIRGLTGAMTAGAVVLAGLVFTLHPWVLARIGDEYNDASRLVMILAIGQVLNVAAGPIGNFYAMVGQERFLLHVIAFSSTVAILAMVVGTARFDSVGAAVGVTIGLAVKNGVLVAACRRRVGVSPVPFLPRAQTESRPAHEAEADAESLVGDGVGPR